MQTKQFNYEEYLKGAKAVSRDGRKVKEIVKFTTESTHQLVVLYEDNRLIRVHENGSAFDNGSISGYDILLVVEPISMWINVYLNGNQIWLGEAYISKDEAIKNIAENLHYIKTIEITNEK
jgi:hypothetical protein